jgi:hypothetical protein
MLNVPVALIIFRRPQFTERVLEAVARVKPSKLLVIADGPRPDRPDDVAACAATRAVIDRVDWDCEVVKNYSEVNLGCGRRPASGISWVFEQFEEAIILEDDCVPNPTFFWFCEELLKKYRDDERIMHIAGSTYRRRPVQTPYSYCFSQFNGAWGWATWRRAWRYFDASLKLWPQLRDTSWLKDRIEDARGEKYWANEYERAYERGGDVSYWDHQWTFACWANSGLSILPRVNLVSNVGCGSDGTHCFDESDLMSNVPAMEMPFPLSHPPMVLQNRDVDRSFLREIVIPRLRPQPLASRTKLRRMLSRFSPRFVKQGYRKIVSAVPFVPRGCVYDHTPDHCDNDNAENSSRKLREFNPPLHKGGARL